MKDYVLKGACDTFAIWNPVEYGYSSTMIMADILAGKDTAEGAKLSMGKKGETTVGKDGECVDGRALRVQQDQRRGIRQDLLIGAYPRKSLSWPGRSGHDFIEPTAVDGFSWPNPSLPSPAYRRASRACGR